MIHRMLEQFNIEAKSIEAVEDSHSSSVYKCTLIHEEVVFLKIPFTKIKYQRELEAYHLLKGHVVIPNILNHFEGDEECPPAFLLSALKGNPLTETVSPSVAFQVGELHASMHRIRPNATLNTIYVKNEYPEWTNFVERQFYSFAKDAKEVLDATLYTHAIKKYEDMKGLLPSPDGPCFLHMDFRPANIIVDGEKVSGVIDFESARFGSTETDFTKLNRDFLSKDAALLNAYQEGYTSVRPLIDLKNVLPFYQFVDAFNSIGWCKRRGLEKNADFLVQNLSLLKGYL